MSPELEKGPCSGPYLLVGKKIEIILLSSFIHDYKILTSMMKAGGSLSLVIKFILGKFLYLIYICTSIMF